MTALAKSASASGAVVATAIVSDATALAVVGLTSRQFRTFLAAHDVPHAKIGRRTVARLDRVLEAVDRLSGIEPRTSWSEAAVIELASARGRR